MESLANCLERRRGRVALVVVGITLLAVLGGSRLTFDDVPRNFFISDDDESATLEVLYEQFGADDNYCGFVVGRRRPRRTSAGS